MRCPPPSLLLLLLLPLLLPPALGGPGDTVDQLRVGFSIVPLADQVTGAPVTVESGSPPPWLSGTMARHACGVYGETGHTFVNSDNETMLNACDHVFDCIEMGQGYHFHQGQVTFTSRYYDTNHVEIWRNSGENMNHTSVWWSTVYATQNRTAIDEYHDAMNGQNSSAVPAVSWWKVGQDVLGMSEWPSGQIVDPHTMHHVGGFPYADDDFLAGFSNEHSAAHEQYSADGTVWSSAAVHKYQGDIGQNKRVVYTLDPVTKKREVKAEWHFNDTDLSLCQEGKPYPDPYARLRQVHSVQMTENFVVVPETCYMYDPCVRKFGNPNNYAGWNLTYSYEPAAPGLVTVVNKTDGSIHQVELSALMITHVLGSYEDPDTDELHFDVLKYDDARAYTYFTKMENILDGRPHPDNFTKVLRYTLNMSDWTLKGSKDLIPDSTILASFEFSNINPNFLGKKYKFAYAVHNMFKLDGAIVKINVDTGALIRKPLPDGLFPTEPIFVQRPGSSDEDDGVVIVSGIDGGKQKGFVVVYNASDMEMLLHATAPKKTLFGVHSKFFAFTEGCSEEDRDCTPTIVTTTTSDDSTTTTTSPDSGSSCPLASLLLLAMLLALGERGSLA